MTYSEYCQERAEILTKYFYGAIGYFTARWAMICLSARYARKGVAS